MCNRHTPGLRRVLELHVAAFGGDLNPAIGLDHPDQVDAGLVPHTAALNLLVSIYQLRKAWSILVCIKLHTLPD
jgi:hypothetical protein